MPDAVKLYDVETGDPVVFDSSQEAAEAFARGEVKPRGERQEVVTGGELGTVKAEDIGQLLAAGGHIASEGEVRRHELEKKYGGVDSALGAGLAGAARGLTFGLSDAAMTSGAFGDAAEARERLAAYQDLHPYASLGGELGAVAATMLIPGGGAANVARVARGVEEASTLARGASLAGEGIGLMGALPRGVSRLGGAVERGVAGIVGEGAESLAGKVLQKSLPFAARSAIEGGALGGQQAITEASLGDHELTAEKLFAGVAHGALAGGVLGGGLGAAGAVAEHAATAVLTKLSPKLQELAAEQAWKALSPLKKFSEEANARAGGTAAVGRTLLEEGVIPRESILQTAKTATAEELLPRISEAKERVGSAIGKITTESGAEVNAGKLFTAINEVVEPLSKKAGFEGIVGALDNYRTSLAEKLGVLDKAGTNIVQDAKIPVAQVLEQRRELDDLVYREAKALDPKLRVEFMRNMRGKIESSVMESIDEAAKLAGKPELTKELAGLKKTYQHLSIAEQAAETSTSRMATNRGLSLTDNMAAMGAVASGHFLAGPVVGFAHSVVRERGNAVSAVLLDRLAALSAIERQTAKVDRAIERSVKGFFGKAKRAESGAAGAASRESIDKEYERAVKEVTEAKIDPARALERARAKVAPVAEHAPETMRSYDALAAKAIAFLATKIPTGTSAKSLQPHLDTPRVSRIQQDRFLDFYRAVNNPAFVMQQFERGQLTRDQVQGLKAGSPKIYGQLCARVKSEVEDQKEHLPYQKLVQMSVLLDKPLDQTMEPAFIRDMQAASQAPPPMATPPPSGPPPQIAKMSQTPTQRVESR